MNFFLELNDLHITCFVFPHNSVVRHEAACVIVVLVIHAFDELHEVFTNFVFRHFKATTFSSVAVREEKYLLPVNLLIIFFHWGRECTKKLEYSFSVIYLSLF